jgi:hypothetical protein
MTSETEYPLAVFRKGRHVWNTSNPMARMLAERQARVWRVEYRGSDTVDFLYVGFPDRGEGQALERVTASQLPDWVHDRVAALNVFGEDYPTDWVDGVGRRIGLTVYYVEE